LDGAQDRNMNRDLDHILVVVADCSRDRGLWRFLATFGGPRVKGPTNEAWPFWCSSNQTCFFAAVCNHFSTPLGSDLRTDAGLWLDEEAACAVRKRKSSNLPIKKFAKVTLGSMQCGEAKGLS
jgi:hypothetical protein